mmetsp:Transcript_20892/g.45291  ORF Transcript_20892/g.45291 Transcript_20892/m.45291 type:complete len:652 (+) Transcript_20892:286-2241(+)|eukprot:CAMPEP_0172312800 /NCGR_PEP_ID=MMETSP1058-20130122/18566_1 /TAXON_ID=83371 /ORGANISM="Detonula confervacea, Strain CCMP 353" /LENGTH=651 /DNA_ID=CAMNT_0013026345 /DNA_START=217 /DNA_END=2172 /DNA_ORIENTATION=+
MPRRRREELPLHVRAEAMRRRRVVIGLLALLPFVIAIVALAVVLPTKSKTIYLFEEEAAEEESSINFLDMVLTTSLPTETVEQITNSSSASSTTDMVDTITSYSTEATASSEISGELHSTLSTGTVEQGAISSTSATAIASDSTTTTITSSSTATLPVSTEQSTATSTSNISSTAEMAGGSQSTLPADETTEQSTSIATISSTDVMGGNVSTPPAMTESSTSYSTEMSAISQVTEQSNLSATVSITEVSDESFSTLPINTTSPAMTEPSTSYSTEMSGGVHSTIPQVTEQSNLSATVPITEVSDELFSTLPTNTTSASTVTTTTSSDSFPYLLPAIRYQPFSQLDESSQTIAKSQLHYTPVTWDVHEFAPIEEKGWRELDPDEKDGALRLGFDRDMWDCFIDHYTSFFWDELNEMSDVKRHLKDLGWTRDNWGSRLGNPVYETKWWHQLTNDERLAASGICYFEENWNPIEMNPNPSYFPYAVPEFRFVPWNQLPSATRQTARNMMRYNETTWNRIYTSAAERQDFYNMKSNERKGARMLGFYPAQWDCHINHFNSWSWKILYGKNLLALETLGWNETCWDYDLCEPASEDKTWNELTPDERGAATMLCYFKETWDGDRITQWFDYEKGANTAVSTDGAIPEGINMTLFAA